ncbi:hypothetical protein [Corallococcus macrosporus]|uniref:Uncharacterized protein n=1 Tax=Corallococcus macrosporus DSM 14697 TaxID=1189310 RepID=A0A250K4Q8_9BACT|nr:hypothetical protein [Corallococcus macrosporus]ATB50968.1 hypothetical protein MYMAC_006625 [Corallococcus macrosporus DSM 14697]
MHDLMPFEPYHVDPDDPRAPPQEVWDALSPEERQRIIDSLPSKLDLAEARLSKLRRQLAEETRRREEAERQLAEARAEIERLRGGRG